MIKIKPDPDPKAAPTWSVMLVGNESRFWRQVGTGLVLSRDKRETRFSLPQPPPIIMINLVVEIVVLVVVDVVHVVVDVVVVVNVVVVVAVLGGGRSFRKILDKAYSLLFIRHLFSSNDI